MNAQQTPIKYVNQIQDKQYIVFSYSGYKRDLIKYELDTLLQQDPKAFTIDYSFNGLVQIMRYDYGDNRSFFLFDDKINDRTTIVRDDKVVLDEILGSIYSEMAKQLSDIYGDDLELDIWDYEFEYYRENEDEEFPEEYEDGKDINILGKQIQTSIKRGNKGGIRIFIDIKDVLQVLYEFIANNYNKGEVVFDD